MKYRVYAKFLGSYMPEKRAKIGDCIIMKSYDQYHFDDDRPEIPTRSKDSEFHCLKRGVANYIYYPQRLISVRTFESEYLIKTEVDTHNEYSALEVAVERFFDVTIVLSLVAKNKMVKLGNKRIRRGDEIYDFEIIGIFLKKGKDLIRLKLPKPFINGRNFFPKQFPKGFLTQAKKYVLTQDLVFKKGLIYFQRATSMRYSGVFNDLEIIMNLIKCIELICKQLEKEGHFGLTKKQVEEIIKKDGFKKIIEFAGKKIGVIRKTVENTKNFWNIRNKGDIAHQDLYFNPYSRKSTNAIINFYELESSVAEFLIKYHKYRKKNPRFRNRGRSTFKQGIRRLLK